MKKASEYRQHADECRALAAQMPSEAQRVLMLEMAEHWDRLAVDRMTLIEKHPELAQSGEHEEERSWRSSREEPHQSGPAWPSRSA